MTGDVTFILLRSFIRASLLHCASQTHLCTRHNVLSAPVKRAIVCGKPFGRKVAQTSACHALNHVSRKLIDRVAQARPDPPVRTDSPPPAPKEPRLAKTNVAVAVTGLPVLRVASA